MTDQHRPLSDADLAELERLHERRSSVLDPPMPSDMFDYCTTDMEKWPCTVVALLASARRAAALEAALDIALRWVNPGSANGDLPDQEACRDFLSDMKQIEALAAAPGGQGGEG